MPANRCSQCATNWPRSYQFAVCPACQTRTSPMTNATALSIEEAKVRVSEIQFGKFYDQTWEPKRKGPDPEEAGRREASELAKAWREVTLGLTDT